MENKDNIIELVQGEEVVFGYNPFCNRALIKCRNIEIRLSRNEMEWLCEEFLRQHSRKKDEYKEKYEELVKDYVRVTSNFVSLLANKK